MEIMTIILILTIVLALGFDIMNGFHDAANSIATIVSTRVLTPRAAILWAAFFNFAAMFIFAPKVADTIAKIVKIEAHDQVYILIIVCGLLGAILWDFLTWWYGLPTSSSHALIGGLSGAALTYGGTDSLRWDLLWTTSQFIVLAPLIGFGLGFSLVVSLYWLLRHWSPLQIDHVFRKGQLLSAACYSIGHGANDAQKTMGVIFALLIANGVLQPQTELSIFDLKTVWIILACHLAMSVGTALGGWRIIKTMGMKITKIKPVGGFCAESAGALTLFLATHTGIPVSTTHTITGSIIGVGSATNKLSSIKWGVAFRIFWAWILTIPGAGIIAAICFICLNILGLTS